MNDKAMKLEEMISYGSREAVIQNLEDAGCPPDVIERCIACIEQGKNQELLKRLEEHRKGLLVRVHKTKSLPGNESCREEKNIDCLDYLVYQIGRCLNESE